MDLLPVTVAKYIVTLRMSKSVEAQQYRFLLKGRQGEI